MTPSFGWHLNSPTSTSNSVSSSLEECFSSLASLSSLSATAHSNSIFLFFFFFFFLSKSFHLHRGISLHFCSLLPIQASLQDCLMTPSFGWHLNSPTCISSSLEESFSSLASLSSLFDSSLSATTHSNSR